jgi:exodeoxyribonuclease V alpha subunit
VGLQTVKGTLADVKFRSEETGFTVGILRTQTRASLTVVGRLPTVPIGSYLRLSGFIVEDEKWGEQFKFKSFEVELPSSAAGIIGYLEYMPNIGKQIAVKVVKHFGEKEVLGIIEKEPHRLVEVPGITKERAEKVHTAYLSHAGRREILIFLKRLQLSDYQINRLLATYKPADIYRVFERNPYELIERVNGFGFKIVDAIAIRNGYDKNGIPRAKAACRHILRLASEEEGHVYLPWGMLKYRLVELGIDGGVAHRAVEFMRQDGYVTIEGENKVFDVIYLQREARCARILIEMMKRGEDHQ